MPEFDKLIEELKKPLKKKGYKKNRYNWYKSIDGLTIVFSIQHSQYGKDLWYYNFGIGINELEGKQITSISKCQIVERLDAKINDKILSAENLIQAITRWEEKYGDLKKLRIKAVENKLPAMTTKQAITYLTTIKF